MISNDHSSRLRVLNKNLNAQVLTFSASVFVIFAIAINLPIFAGPWHFLVRGLLVSLGVIAVTTFLMKAEKASLSEYGLHWRKDIIKHSIIGLSTGILTMLLIFILLLTFSNLDFVALSSASLVSFLLTSIPILLMLAFMEEVAFRGYLLFKLKQQFGVRTSVYLTALAFGLYHGLVIESLIGPAVWGLIFALFALYSKGLALPTLFHFALNWMQALFNMKQKYTPGLYEFIQIDGLPIIDERALGLIIQGIILILAIILIEAYCRQNRKNINC
ncbi:CPBP family intramembrane glutamic endopeptidase [Pleionea sediminis]|uniref:CPBP family intramembrane glutamic endopeptidase n=1 Tax=Pleionea sediminis TaxID=2569479 RepID=UPI001184B733|nr:type II CAAX endopeptidase family protein [Pleionea sediminis]